MKIFDWDTAARRIVESGCQEARAGLDHDWFFTGGTIYESGRPDKESYTYLASTWAVPILVLDGAGEECWVSQHANWNAKTTWPDSALALLKKEDK